MLGCIFDKLVLSENNILRFKYNIVMKRFLLNNVASIFSYTPGVTILEGVTKQSLERVIQRLKPKWDPKDLIRIGGDNDGGYLVATDIDEYDMLISPGVGDAYDFDKYFINREIDSVLIDPGVNMPSMEHLVHIKKFLGTVCSESENTISLDHIIDQYGKGKKKIILQIDIEGAEYAVISSTQDHILSKFGMIIIEFHYLGGLCYRGMLPIIENAFNKLLNNHFVAHIHVNNSCRVVPYKGLQIPDTMEFTFLNKKIYKENHAAVFKSPSSLDVMCLKSAPVINVPKCWW